MVGQVAQTLFGKLGRTLEETATALEGADPRRADAALAAARGTDDDVDELEQTISVAVETARFSPARRGGLADVQRYEQTMPQLDFAVRDTRVLARYAARQVRLGEPAPQLAGAVRELAVRGVAARRAVRAPRSHGRRPPRRARRGAHGRGDPRPRAVAADDADRRPGALGGGRRRPRRRGARRQARARPTGTSRRRSCCAPDGAGRLHVRRAPLLRRRGRVVRAEVARRAQA